jgi:hypothetical protein
MVDWATVCKSKAFGGLRILNTKLMNIALMPNGFGNSTKTQRVYGRSPIALIQYGNDS